MDTRDRVLMRVCYAVRKCTAATWPGCPDLESLVSLVSILSCGTEAGGLHVARCEISSVNKALRVPSQGSSMCMLHLPESQLQILGLNHGSLYPESWGTHNLKWPPWGSWHEAPVRLLSTGG